MNTAFKAIDLTGRTAIVTGAAQGMGLVTAQILRDLGATVILTDLDAERGQAAAADMGEGAFFQPLDVTSAGQWQDCVARATEVASAPPTILINNAGAYQIQPIAELTAANFDLHVDVNLRGPLLGIQAVLPGMQAAGGGSVVNISSIAGTGGYMNIASYTMSKWGLRGLTKAAAKELGPLGIRVNCILPGLIDTRMASNNSAQTNAAYIQQMPLRRIGQAEEVAWTSAFLASDLAAFTTGADIVIDGGQTLS